MVNLYQFGYELEKSSRAILEAMAKSRRRAQVSPHFDEAFYRFCYGDTIPQAMDALEHYLTEGCVHRFDPNPEFSTRDYFEDYADFRHAGDALYDFLRSGKAAGRTPRPSRNEVDYFTAQQFDGGYYLAMNADVRGEWSNPLKHYVELGWREGRDPNPHFSTRYYLDRYIDARESGVNPLYHYVRVGQVQGRQHSPVPKDSQAIAGRGARWAQDGRLDSLFSRLLHIQPEFATKWLKTNYLATGLSELQRAQCFMFHYQFMMNTFSDTLLDDVLFKSLELWSSEIDDVRHSIVLKQSRPSLVEGELSLEFQVDALCLYTLSFSIIPSDFFGARSDPQVLISRLQGGWSLWPQIKQATRCMKDVSPSFALVAALQGLASATDIHILAGVSAQHQSARASTYKSDFDQAYDQLFRSLGAEAVDAMLFTASLPLVEKPMTEVKPGHRIRTRTKRAIKHGIAQAAATVVSNRLRERSAWRDGAPVPRTSLGAPSLVPALASQSEIHVVQVANDPEIPMAAEAFANA